MKLSEHGFPAAISGVTTRGMNSLCFHVNLTEEMYDQMKDIEKETGQINTTTKTTTYIPGEANIFTLFIQ